MESFSDSFERKIDPVLNELFVGYGAVLERKGRLVDTNNPEDGYKYSISGTELLARFGIQNIQYGPRYYSGEQEFPESLMIEQSDGEIDKMIFLTRNSETGAVDSNIWLSVSGEETRTEKGTVNYDEEISENDMRRIIEGIAMQLRQTIDMEDVVMLQQLLAELRTELD